MSVQCVLKGIVRVTYLVVEVLQKATVVLDGKEAPNFFCYISRVCGLVPVVFLRVPLLRFQ